ncbi:CHAD domain-containing protein [Rhodoferax ferrireducens]|uniref:CYTH and CHAD domain-containing protein n=1 Tax=Rhodoferax ferrireducens TaxID=192843 RepID=UPI000E0D1F15|nr:CYTH and CHAD domain-containing protein [Rhodoferax ferrireducens]
MKPAARPHSPEEIELKLALPGANPSSLAKQLARSPVLARRQPTHQHLHNVYYDTPEQHLRQQRIALRIRRVGSEAKPKWLQTLKTGGRSDSALSQRGEWETPVPNANLSLKALNATPWSGIDPDGSLFQALAPSFVTSFERTIWLVRKRDGSVVEVALDLGHIVAGDKTTPICELEFELKAGQPAALFDIAQQIARTLAVLPATMSKAERGYALAQDGLDTPLRAQPPRLTSELSVLAAAQRVLSEMFCQFTRNLNALRSSDDPEVVHQARVGWRRFKSASRLFRPVLALDAMPSRQPLQTLLSCLGELRDIDVARTETLPPLAEAYAAGNERRAQAWQAMTQALTQGAELQRKAVRYALQEPSVGASLLATTQWLEGLTASPTAGDAVTESKLSLRRWSRRRIDRLHAQFKRALKDACDPESQHRARILAKRMRYGIEALRSLLPKKRAQRWGQQATGLQTSIGTTRDLMQAATLVARLELDRGLAEFLRGVAAGSVARP